MNTLKNRIEKRIPKLKGQLERLIESDSMKFDEVKSIDSSGVYVVFRQGRPIYAGKTERTGTERLREIASDFRSHTLNSKLMIELLNEQFNLDVKKLRKSEHKRELISKGLVTEEQFGDAQREVNRRVKSNFKIKFMSAQGRKLLGLEHFVIGVLSPKYND